MITSVFLLILLFTNNLLTQPTNNNVADSDDFSVRKMKSLCVKDDTISCLKYRMYKYLDNAIDNNKFQIFDDIEIKRNSYRAGKNIPEHSLEKYIEEHDITLKFPLTDSSMRISGRDFNVEGRKSKLKKILVPILVFVLLKAMTLIPLALGVLGLKAWNALQLAFFSFVTSLALAIFQLCKKIASDNSAAYAAHTTWDPAYKRSLNDIFTQNQDKNDEQQMAYRKYQ